MLSLGRGGELPLQIRKGTTGLLSIGDQELAPGRGSGDGPFDLGPLRLGMYLDLGERTLLGRLPADNLLKLLPRRRELLRDIVLFHRIRSLVGGLGRCCCIRFLCRQFALQNCHMLPERIGALLGRGGFGKDSVVLGLGLRQRSLLGSLLVRRLPELVLQGCDPLFGIAAIRDLGTHFLQLITQRGSFAARDCPVAVRLGSLLESVGLCWAVAVSAKILSCSALASETAFSAWSRWLVRLARLALSSPVCLSSMAHSSLRPARAWSSCATCCLRASALCWAVAVSARILSCSALASETAFSAWSRWLVTLARLALSSPVCLSSLAHSSLPPARAWSSCATCCLRASACCWAVVVSARILSSLGLGVGDGFGGLVALSRKIGQTRLHVARLLVEPALLGLDVGHGFRGLVALGRQAGERGLELAHLSVESGLLGPTAGELVVQGGDLLLQGLGILLGGGGVSDDPVVLGLGIGDGFGGLVALGGEIGQTGFELTHLLVETGLFGLAAGELIAQCGELLIERLGILLGRGGIGHDAIVLGPGI